MNIIIIEPCDLNKRYDLKSLTPSLGPVTIATLLYDAGHSVSVFSEYVTDVDKDAVNRADLVGISITTYNAKRGFKLAQDIKPPVVFGGFHASLAPDECLDYGDYVIRGDGHPVVLLADFLSNGILKQINQIPNLVYKKEGQIFYNPSATKAVDVVPDFSMVKDYHRVNLHRMLRIPLLTNGSRGCHFNCSFCSIKAIYPDFKKKNKATLIQDIKTQIKHQPFLSKFLPRIVWITDDNFFSDKAWAKGVLKELITLKTQYRFVIQARPDIAGDDELLSLLKKAGIGIVYMGIESLNPQSLADLNKDLTIKEITDAIKKIKRFGIDVHGLFVFGDDAFEKGDGLKVAQFVKHHNLSGALIQPLIPFPGTRLYAKLKQEGRLLHEDWQFYNGKVVFRPRNMTAAELQQEICDCYRRVFSPLRVIRFLLKGPKGFRLAGLGEAVFRHLECLKSRNYIKDKLSYQAIADLEQK